MKIPIISDIVESIINVLDKDIHIGEVVYMGIIARDITIKRERTESKTKVELIDPLDSVEILADTKL